MKKNIMFLGLVFALGISTQVYAGTLDNPDSITRITSCRGVPISLNRYNPNYIWYSSTRSVLDTASSYAFTLTKKVDTIYARLQSNIPANDNVIMYIISQPANITDIDTVVACQTCSWRGKTYAYNSSGNTLVITNGIQTIRDTISEPRSCGDTVFHYLFLQLYGPKTTSSPRVYCDSYLWNWNGQTYYADGTYTSTRRETLPSGNSCELTDTLHLTLKGYSVTDTTTDTLACNTYSFDWKDTNDQLIERYISAHDSTITTSRRIIGTTVNGCDSMQVLNLIFRFNKTKNEQRVVCDSLPWHDSLYTSSTTAIYRKPAEKGCDSIISLNLTINNSTHSTDTTVRCNSYNWHGITFTESTNAPVFDTINHNGCDSTVHLNLTINKDEDTAIFEAVCGSYDNDHLNLHFNNSSPSQQSKDTVVTLKGRTTNLCDSIYNIHLILNPITRSETNDTACDNYTWFGQTHNQTGSYYETVRNQYGCDSIITLNLTINTSTHNTTRKSACNSFTWNNETYTSSGTYTYSYTNDVNCPSTDTLSLTIIPNEGTNTNVTECEKYVYEFNDSTYTESDTLYNKTHAASGCDRVDTIVLTILGIKVPDTLDLVEKSNPLMLIYPIPYDDTNQDYHFQWYRGETPIPGATKQYYKLSDNERLRLNYDSIYTVKVWNKLEMCSSISTHTIKRVQSTDTPHIETLPNPSTGRFTATLHADDEVAVEASLYNAYGNKVTTLALEGNQAASTADLTPGVYLVNIVTRSGKIFTDKIIVK